MNNSRILRIQNATFSGYYFYMDIKMLIDFQICISVPLTQCVTFPWSGSLSEFNCLCLCFRLASRVFTRNCWKFLWYWQIKNYTPNSKFRPCVAVGEDHRESPDELLELIHFLYFFEFFINLRELFLAPDQGVEF